MSTAPTFSLPLCPVCSSAETPERPFWRFAHNTSRARGKDAYILSGCLHAEEVCGKGKVRDDPEEWRQAEDAWGDRVSQLFDLRTERWTEGQRERFRAALFPAAAPTDSPPAEPAQHEPHEEI